MAIRFLKVRSFSVRRRAQEEAGNEAAWSEVMSYRSPLSEEYQRTKKPGTMLKPYAEKQRLARKVRKGRKVKLYGEKITVRGS